jgi:hypothetical protein
MLPENFQSRLRHHVDIVGIAINPTAPGYFQRGERQVGLLGNLNLDHLHGGSPVP